MTLSSSMAAVVCHMDDEDMAIYVLVMSQDRVTRDFFQQNTLVVARALLGKELVHVVDGERVGGRIVETEAYLTDDPACHASRGMTPRNEPMFEAGGISYVYFIYGMYRCFNVVTGKKGEGEAVLIRAIEPLYGIEQMKLFRGSNKPLTQLCSGPGKLTDALQITRDHNRQSVLRGNLRIVCGEPLKNSAIATSGRIGIREGSELPYRFFVKDCPFVSPGRNVKAFNALKAAAVARDSRL